MLQRTCDKHGFEFPLYPTLAQKVYIFLLPSPLSQKPVSEHSETSFVYELERQINIYRSFFVCNFGLIFASRNFFVVKRLFLGLSIFHSVAVLFDAARIFFVLQFAS